MGGDEESGGRGRQAKSERNWGVEGSGEKQGRRRDGDGTKDVSFSFNPVLFLYPLAVKYRRLLQASADRR